MNKLIFILTIIVVLSLNIFAQFGGVRGLPNGLFLSTYSESTIDGKRVPIVPEYGMSYEDSDKNTITRSFANFFKNKFYSYDLEVERTDEVDKYKITMKPISEASMTNIKSKFSQYPKLEIISVIKEPITRIVNDGDLLSINVLENSETNHKTIDYIKVTKEWKPFGNYFPEKNYSTATDFSLEDVELKLSKFEIYVNGKLVQKINGGAAGSLVWINFPEGKAKGRFIFSIIPREGYDFQKTGNIKDYTIEFNFLGDNYQIVSSIPIISTHKNWNLWILHQPDYKPAFGGFEIGGADSVKGLFIRFPPK